MSSETRILAGDIGGTKTILALFETDGCRLERVAEASFPSREYESFDAVLAAFRSRVDGGLGVGAVCLDVAGPVRDGTVRPTNLLWRIDERGLSGALGGVPVKLLNDLEATAFGMLFLPESELVELNAGARPPRRGHIAVIAAGTGLGEAYLIWDGERHCPLASEGGHADFAPRSEVELDLLRYLRSKLGGRVSYERVLSGPGIHNIYEFLRDSGREAEPAWLATELVAGDPSAAISRAARERAEPICVAAMDLFSELYGAEAGNMALRALTYGGVFVGGGIAPKNLDVLRNGSFLRGFLDKGRFSEMLSEIDVRIATNPATALLGAAQFARRLWLEREGRC